MTNEQQLRALIWDMGGVLVRNQDPARRGGLGAPFGLSCMDLENLFFGNEKALQASVGKASEQDAWNFVQDRLGIAAEDMPMFIDSFYACDQLDEELFAFTMQLRPRYKVGLLSNAFATTRAGLARRYPRFYEMFDVTVFSAEEGIAKPDPAIYRLVLNRLGVAAEESVFVDDFIENVTAAHALGIHAIHFRSAAQVLAELKELFR